MRARQRCTEPLVAQHCALDRRVVEGNAAEPDIDSALLQRRDLLHRRQLDKAECHLGSRRAIGADHLGQVAIERRADKSDDQACLLYLAEATHHRLHLVHPIEHLNRLLEQQPAGIGQRQRPACPIEQRDTDLILELLDLPAERRLGDVQLLGRAGEIALPRNGDEIAELTRLQDDTLQV